MFCKRLLLLLLASDSVQGFAALPPPKVPSQGFVADAELKHARVALLALPTITALTAVDSDPITFLSRQPTEAQLLFFSVAAMIEAGCTLPRLGPNFSLAKDVIPGNFFGLSPPTDSWITATELGLGRCAMLATATLLLLRIP